MDCHDARHLLTLQRREPDQVDSVEVEALERHVELCPGCQNWNLSEARFDSAVTAAFQNVRPPAGLKAKVAARLAASRPIRRGPWVAAAAVLLLAVGATAAYVMLQPTPVDLQQFIDATDEEFGNRPQAVQTYFATLGHSMTAPPQFDYDYLIDYKLSQRQGHMVPRLTFQRSLRSGGVVTAHVYCLSPWQFRMSDDESTIQTSRHRGQVYHGDSQIYVVVSSGGDLGLLQPSTY